MQALKDWLYNKIFKVYRGNPERKKYRKYKIYVKGRKSCIKFKGRYLRDIESDNWHYYEDHKGILWHFRKENIQGVHGDDMQSVMDNKAEKG